MIIGTIAWQPEGKAIVRRELLDEGFTYAHHNLQLNQVTQSHAQLAAQPVAAAAV